MVTWGKKGYLRKQKGQISPDAYWFGTPTQCTEAAIFVEWANKPLLLVPGFWLQPVDSPWAHISLTLCCMTYLAYMYLVWVKECYHVSPKMSACEHPQEVSFSWYQYKCVGFMAWFHFMYDDMSECLGLIFTFLRKSVAYSVGFQLLSRISVQQACTSVCYAPSAVVCCKKIQIPSPRGEPVIKHRWPWGRLLKDPWYARVFDLTWIAMQASNPESCCLLSHKLSTSNLLWCYLLLLLILHSSGVCKMQC